MTECIHCGATDDEEHGIVVALVGDANQSVCNVCRAEQLQDETVLKRREAQVYALREQGYSDERVAETLQALHNSDSPKSGTISTHRSNIRKKLKQARQTLNEIDESRL